MSNLSCPTKRACHSERSEEPDTPFPQVPRYARNDTLVWCRCAYLRWHHCMEQCGEGGTKNSENRASGPSSQFRRVNYHLSEQRI